MNNADIEAATHWTCEFCLMEHHESEERYRLGVVVFCDKECADRYLEVMKDTP